MPASPAIPGLLPFLLPAFAATLGIALGAGLTPGCGGCAISREAMRAFLAGCPCQPGEADDGADTSGLAADDGCGRSLEIMQRGCECGVAPPDDPDTGNSSTGDDTGAVCDGDTPVTLYLSADDSNSMSSPVQVRAAALSFGGSIAAVPVRPWEFFNYYEFDYPPAPAGDVAVTAELAAIPGTNGSYMLQIGVSSPAIAATQRPPVNLTFVLDTSGSMKGTPLEHMKDVCKAVAAALRPGDVVSVVTWSDTNTVVLAKHAVTGADDPALLDAIAALAASGGTDLHAGLTAGYALAGEAAQPGVISRVILVSDGGANLGETSVPVIADAAAAENDGGIYMVGVGVGTPATYNDTLMDRVTDAGKGASVFIPETSEATRVFHDRFVNTMMIAARDVQVQLDLPPGFVIERFSGEEFSADPSQVEPQHLAPNDAMVFHQRISTCAPEMVTAGSTVTVTARYLDAATLAPRAASITRSFAELTAEPAPRLHKGAALVAYVDALTALRVDDAAAPMLVEAADLAIADALVSLPNDAALMEWKNILEQL